MNLPIVKTGGHLIPLLFYFFSHHALLLSLGSPKVSRSGLRARVTEGFASRDQRSLAKREAGSLLASRERITTFGKEKERNELCQRSDTKVVPKTKFSMRNTVKGDKKVYRELSF